MRSIVLVAILVVAAATPAQPAVDDLVEAAIERTKHRVTYDGSYRRIDYPNGDVPDHIGVCTDLVVRAYRATGVDLQKKVHEDMAASFDQYPTIWGLSRPDANIDHRRVPNLRVFFERNGKSLRVSTIPDDYHAGDLVTWMLPGDLPHIGIVTHKRSHDGRRPLIVHNIGRGPEVEDMIFNYPITGHYRYVGKSVLSREQESFGFLLILERSRCLANSIRGNRKAEQWRMDGTSRRAAGSLQEIR